MTGYVRTCDGRRLTLPALLQWSVRLTDGDPCDSFSVRFLYEAELSEALRKAVLFEAEELGRMVFTGVVDDYEIRMDKKGLLVEMTGRGLAALLLDNQVRAAEYVRAQLEDMGMEVTGARVRMVSDDQADVAIELVYDGAQRTVEVTV